MSLHYCQEVYAPVGEALYSTSFLSDDTIELLQTPSDWRSVLSGCHRDKAHAMYRCVQDIR